MTLTQTAQAFRTFVKVFAVLIVAVIAIRGGTLMFEIFFPPEPPEPPAPVFDAKFGALPVLNITTSLAQYADNYSGRLDLLQSSLPTTPEVAYVYPVLKAPYGFLSEDRAKEVADAFGLFGDPYKLSAIESVWRGPNQTLTVNDQTLNFFYQYRYNLDPSVFVNGTYTSAQQVIIAAQELRESYNIFGGYADDLGVLQPKIYLVKYQNQTLQPATDFSDVTAVRVDFIRNRITYALGGQSTRTYDFVSPNYVGSVAYVLMGTKDLTTPQPLEVSHTLWRYNASEGGTYPVLSSVKAWEMLQAQPQKYTVYVGNLSLGPLDRNTSIPTISTLTVKTVTFSYYNPKNEMDYIQPVWVFKGKAGLNVGGELDWVAYVPAIDTAYVDTSTITPTATPPPAF
ncbi:hypothetical protein KC614_05015 [candidate division WWE3 bacterium]|uniref:Uncharacterized protein n=1 Tax=candidate division WWE3 bacterium TaxID=2053526 RepID=A0A955LL74_UNCKA|nr:hypothetical protein [candidate division WWE3 bacterium]